MKRSTKTFLTTIGSVMFGAAIFLSPFAINVVHADSYGDLDPFTGEPVVTSSGVNEVATLSNRKLLSDNMYYDFYEGKFAYPIDTGITDVCSNAADGMVLTEPVYLEIPEGVSLMVYKDGQRVDLYSEYHDRGSYTVRYNSSKGEQQLFSFTIVGPKTGAIHSYQLPKSFRVDSVTLNGKEISTSRNFIEMEEEGVYAIAYRCERTDIRYYLDVTIDHTPPEVVFTGIDDDDKARGPVSWEGLKDTDTLLVFKDGGEFLYEDNRLTQSGRYTVMVYDDAGNGFTKNFTILIYLDKNGFMFVGVIALVIGALVGYLIWQRKHMKVR